MYNKERYGTRKPIDDIVRLTTVYPNGNSQKWQKVKAKSQILFENGEIIDAEVHWYEEPTVGKVEFKLKEEL